VYSAHKIAYALETLAMSLKVTIDKIKNLEAEKRNLITEIEALKKMADAKAATLESEVDALRDEVKALKVLVSGPEPPQTPSKIQI
jgi:peptidoglycan hydrolase CwlO-like protein